MKLHYLAAVSVLTLSGCASSSLQYAKPDSKHVNNQIILNQDFDQVWDRLVRNLAADFFVINNIEKNSRIINVSFSTSRPMEFVSCGQSTRQFKNAYGTQTFVYDPAQSTQFPFTNDFGVLFNANRKTYLEGRTNIYLAPEGENTVVSVNTKYLLKADIEYRNNGNQVVQRDSFVFDFSTKSAYEASNGDGVVCVATGELEQKLLDYAR